MSKGSKSIRSSKACHTGHRGQVGQRLRRLSWFTHLWWGLSCGKFQKCFDSQGVIRGCKHISLAFFSSWHQDVHRPLSRLIILFPLMTPLFAPACRAKMKRWRCTSAGISPQSMSLEACVYNTHAFPLLAGYLAEAACSQHRSVLRKNLMCCWT